MNRRYEIHSKQDIIIVGLIGQLSDIHILTSICNIRLNYTARKHGFTTYRYIESDSVLIGGYDFTTRRYDISSSDGRQRYFDRDFFRNQSFLRACIQETVVIFCI